MQQFYRKSSFFIFLWFVSTAIWGQITTVQGHIRDMKGRPLPNVRVLPASDSSRCQTNSEGYYQVPISEREITPTLDLDPLNGVNTYDLILISRHILGLEPMSTPYKLISADANKSGTVTTLDIIALRKLILGTYQTLPNNNSWRFVDAAQVFTNPENPFDITLFEDVKISASSPHTDVNFIGCKIGDIDLSAVPSNRAARAEQRLSWSVEGAKNSPIQNIPVRYEGNTALDGLQFALRFDPTQLELVGPSAGDLEGVDNQHFGLTRLSEGLVSFSWNTQNYGQALAVPGSTLFYLNFKVIGDLNEQNPVLTIDEVAVPDGGWTADGTAYHLVGAGEATARSEASTAVGGAMVVPNPVSGDARLVFESDQAGKGRFALTGAFGQQLAFREITVSKGEQQISLPEIPSLPHGVYVWWLKLPNGTIQHGQVVK